jgi:hypothetical protein
VLCQVADIEAAEKDKMKQKCEAIVAHGINIFVNRQLIYNYPEQVGAELARRWPAAVAAVQGVCVTDAAVTWNTHWCSGHSPSKLGTPFLMKPAAPCRCWCAAVCGRGGDGDRARRL